MSNNVNLEGEPNSNKKIKELLEFSDQKQVGGVIL